MLEELLSAYNAAKSQGDEKEVNRIERIFAGVGMDKLTLTFLASACKRKEEIHGKV